MIAGSVSSLYVIVTLREDTESCSNVTFDTFGAALSEIAAANVNATVIGFVIFMIFILIIVLLH
jgi:ABC-type transport system involved in multi-copper enzyme maturation permease subunit